MTVYIHQHTLV